MKKIIVTLCSLALSLAGTFGINQLANDNEVILDINEKQVNIEQDIDAVDDKADLPVEMGTEDKASDVEEDAPKAENTETIDDKTEDDRQTKDAIKKDYTKEEKKTTVNKDKVKKASKEATNKKDTGVNKEKYVTNKANEQYKNNDSTKQNDNTSKVDNQAANNYTAKKNNNTNNIADNNTNNSGQKKYSDYVSRFKSNGNNVLVYKNIDLSNCDSTEDIVEELQKNGYKNININNIEEISSLQDILSIIGNKNTQGKDNGTAPTPAPSTPAPSTPAPSTPAPSKPAPTPAPPKPTPTAPSTNSGSNQNFADEVLRLVNIERSKAGLSSLTTNATLKAAADKRAQETEISFSHTRPNGSKFSTALQEYGVSFRTAGENIAYGQRSPQEVVTGWMNSPGHRANILNGSFGKIGIGVYQSKGVIYWSQLFTD